MTDLEEALGKAWLAGFQSRTLLTGNNIPAAAQAIADAKAEAIAIGLQTLGER